MFDGFARPQKWWSWAGVDKWLAVEEARLGPARERISQLRAWWHEALADIGGDPSVRDWTTFRALRRDREEDWSDWLAQLLEDSTTGWFAWALLARFEERAIRTDYMAACVQREVSYDGYRADIVIEWADASTYTHIEVKTGDPNLDKTLMTALKMERRELPRRSRSDLILLLPEQSEAWSQACARQVVMGERVRMMTWIEVARALREALRHAEGEPVHWRAWAHAFCGVIEQQLLRLPAGPLAREWTKALKAERLATAERLFLIPGEK